MRIETPWMLKLIFYTQKQQGDIKLSHFSGRNWEQNSHMYRVCTIKYITYIYAYKTGLDQLENYRVHPK